METFDGNLVSTLESEVGKELPRVQTSSPASSESKETATSTQPNISNKFTFNNKSTSGNFWSSSNNKSRFGNIKPSSKATQPFVFSATEATRPLEKPYKFVFRQLPPAKCGTDKIPFVFKFPSTVPLNTEFKFVGKAADSNISNEKNGTVSDKAVIAFNNFPSQSAQAPFNHGDLKPGVNASCTVSEIPIFCPMLSSPAPIAQTPTPQTSASNTQNPAHISSEESIRQKGIKEFHSINTKGLALDTNMKAEEAVDERILRGNTSSNEENDSLQSIKNTIDKVPDADKITSDITVDSTINTPKWSFNTVKSMISDSDTSKEAEYTLDGRCATAKSTEGLLDAVTSSLNTTLDTSTIADTSINIINGEGRPLDISMTNDKQNTTGDKLVLQHLNSKMNTDDNLGTDVDEAISDEEDSGTSSDEEDSTTSSDEDDSATSSDDEALNINNSAVNRAAVIKTGCESVETETSSDDEHLETENSVNDHKNDDQTFSALKKSPDQDLNAKNTIVTVPRHEINPGTKVIVEANQGIANKDPSGTFLNDSEIQSRFAKFSLKPTGTTLEKFEPVFGTQVTVARGVSTPVTVRHQCITNMRVYEHKSLEELRLEDYKAGRKRRIHAAPLEAYGDRCFGNLIKVLELRRSSVDTRGCFSGAPTLAAVFEPAEPGTTLVKYKPLVEVELIVTSCPTRNNTVHHQCIASMKEYKNNCIEELRLVDYKAGRGRPLSGSLVSSFGAPASPQIVSVAARSFDGDASSTAGTTLAKYTPFFGFDEVQKSGVPQLVNANYQSITLMQEYENKCIEELRAEDYRAGRGRVRVAGPALFGGIEAVIHTQKTQMDLPESNKPNTATPNPHINIFTPSNSHRKSIRLPRARRTIIPALEPRNPIIQSTQLGRTIIPAPESRNPIIQSPQLSRTIIPAPESRNPIIQSPQLSRTIIPAPESRNPIIQSPQLSRTILPAPDPRSPIIQSPRPGRTTIPAPDSRNPIIQSTQLGRTIIPAPESRNPIIQSPQTGRTIIQSPQPGRTIIQSPQPGRTTVPEPEPCRTNVSPRQRLTAPFTSSPSADGSTLTSLRFHSLIGSELVLNEDRSVIRMMTSHCSENYAYSERPIAIGERVCFRLVDLLDGVIGLDTVSFGLIFRSPRPLTIMDKMFSKAYRTEHLLNIYSKKNNIVLFYVNSSGHVYYGVNGRHVGVLFEGVNTRQPFWAMIKLNKPAAVQLVAHLGPLDETRASQMQSAVEPVGQSIRSSPVRLQSSQDNSINSPNTRQQTALNTSTYRQTVRQQYLNTSTRSQPFRQHTTQNTSTNYQAHQTQITPPSLTAVTQSQDPIPLNLHTIKGANVNISSGVTTRIEPDIPQAYVFAAVPMRPGQTIILQIMSTVTGHTENFAYGLTSCDPSTIRATELPDEAYFLHDRPEYWTVHKAEGSLQVLDQVTFTLTSDGRVEERQNDSNPKTVMHVDATQNLWAFVDLCGGVQKARLLTCTGAPTVPRSVSTEQPERPTSGSINGSQLSPENSRSDGPDSLDTECKVCFDNTVNSVLYMCGHMCMCYECAIQLRHDGDGTCPICRAVISDVIRTYRS